MSSSLKTLLLLATHLGFLLAGVGLGIYLLPILTAPDDPPVAEIQQAADTAKFTGTFVRDLADSDALHWGEGTLYVSRNVIAFEGSLAPGPDYRLYLSPEFIETEADFEANRSRFTQVGHVRSFGNFMLQVPEGIDPHEYTTAIVWCESFGQFITAATYR